MAKIEYDTDPLNGHEHIDEIVGIVDDNSLNTEEGVEYTISSNDDGMLYRVVQVGDDRKINLSTGTAVLPSNCQYVLIDSANGYIVAPTGSSNVSDTDGGIDVNSARPRPSVAIAPKVVKVDVDVAAKAAASARSSTGNAPAAVFKKRDDRRRATHNEVERRRRDKINHWIMKLGSIIPADGSSIEIGDSERVSIAAVEGQSKGGILSKACEYVQMLQDRLASTNNRSPNLQERKNAEEEIVRLRQENEYLRDILQKSGIQFAYQADNGEKS